MSAAVEAEPWHAIHRMILPDNGVPVGAERLYLRGEGSAIALDRRTLSLEPGARADFGTYFGALPSGSWVSEANVRRVRLSAEFQGVAQIRVFGTGAAGEASELSKSTARGSWGVEILLDERSDGWLWFDVEAVGRVTMRDAHWSAPAAQKAAMVSVAVTTFDRNDDCVSLLRRLASDAELEKRVLHLVVADQGTRPIRDHDGFAEAAALWGNRLRVIEQDNLGGSGGFSRGMIEALDGQGSHVLLLDDDVSLEPESVLRMLALADHAHGEPLIGSQMLRLTEPTRLHSWGERIDRRRFWWEPVAPALSGVDLASSSPDRSPLMSTSFTVDYNGWWMCLIPTTVVRRVGAALPLFIKWDDAEYGLRAAEAGHRTVTLPGAALWHMPWTVKDDGLDWQAYYQLRNRLVTALIHSPHRRGGGLLRDVLALDVNHILCLQYGSAAVRQLAFDDVLSGPEHLMPTLRTRPALVRAMLREEGQTLRERDAGWRVRRSGAPVAPSGRRARLGRLLRVLRHQMRASDRLPGEPEGDRAEEFDVGAVLRREDGKWWSLGLEDKVFLKSASGREGFLLRRDRRRAAALIMASLRSTAVLWWRWPELARRYRAEASAMADPDMWKKVFAGS